MKTTNSLPLSVVLQENTDISDTAQLVLINGINIKFNITKELRCSTVKTRDRIGRDLQEYIKQVLQSPDSPLHNAVGLLKDGAPSMAGWISGMSSRVCKTQNIMI